MSQLKKSRYVDLRQNTLNESDEDIADVDLTFFNPYSGFSCESCDFVSKSNEGLEKHINSKHTADKLISPQTSYDLDPNIIAEEESETISIISCDKCDSIFENEEDLNKHLTEKHEKVKDTKLSKIGLELFALVDWDNDVMEARKRILDKLGTTDEVQDVLKVHVDKFESFLDVDGLRWNSVGYSIIWPE